MQSSSFLALMLVGALVVSGHTQEQAKPYALHVYANRIQVPTLVLKKRPRDLAPQITFVSKADTTLNLRQFRVSLDSGGLFQPTGVHVQGEEPIDLRIVLDLSEHGRILPARYYERLDLMAKDLRPQDRVSLYAFGCHAVRPVEYVPVEPPAMVEKSGKIVKPGTIGAAVKQAFEAPLESQAGERRCDSSQMLGRMMRSVVGDLGKRSGRHAVFLFSNAEYAQAGLQEIVDFGSRYGVTVFGVRTLSFGREDPVVELCTRTGGYVFAFDDLHFDEVLLNLVPDLRSRYILEFPRPDGFTSGHHTIDVKITSPEDFAIPAGAYAVLDSTDPNDPSLIKGSPSPAVVGRRRAVTTK